MAPIDASKVLLTNRTAAETDDKCPMRWWLSQREGPTGKGIVPKEEALALMVGRTVHEDFAWIANAADEELTPGKLERRVQEILQTLPADSAGDQKKMEILFRRLGWTVAWALFIEPRTRSVWENVAVEEEIILDRAPLWVAVTPDRVLRHRQSGMLKYNEYKSTITAKKQWLDSWKYAIQIHTSLAAIGEELGRKVDFGEVIALMKGYESESDHRLIHPYVWGYYNEKEDKWEHDYQKARGSLWVPRPIWEYPGGLVQWVIRLGEETAQSQFPRTDPLFLNDRVLNQWVARRTHRERIIKAVTEDARKSVVSRNIYFPMIQSQCRPAFGEACPYLPICWNAAYSLKPSSHPDFVPRQPHHEIEAILA